MGMIKEFRDFAMRGNVADMAVGIIIGGAFTGIVKSLIDDIVMPVIGVLGKVDFSNLYVGLTEETRNKIGRRRPRWRRRRNLDKAQFWHMEISSRFS